MKVTISIWSKTSNSGNGKLLINYGSKTSTLIRKEKVTNSYGSRTSMAISKGYVYLFVMGVKLLFQIGKEELWRAINRGLILSNSCIIHNAILSPLCKSCTSSLLLKLPLLFTFGSIELLVGFSLENSTIFLRKRDLIRDIAWKIKRS